MLSSSLRRHVNALASLVQAVVTGPLAPAEARDLAALFARVEKLGCAGKTAAASSLAGSTVHGQRNCAAWLSTLSGEPPAATRALLDAAHQARTLPEVGQAFLAGELSARQLSQIASAGTAQPEAARQLLALAREGSYTELTAQADTVRREAAGEAALAAGDARAHAERCLRVGRRVRGGVRGEFVLTDADWARCLARLEPTSAAILAAAPGPLSKEASMADALVVLVGRRAGSGGTPADPGAAPVRAVVRVDATALRRGSALPGETCEIAGVGTVSVTTARQLLGDSLLRILVVQGTDVRTVTSQHRTIPGVLRAALAERDRTCVVPGCHAALGLQIDHWHTDFSAGGPTSLDNLARICKIHHDMHTYGGWHLTGGPGRWQWKPPPDPPTFEQIAQARRRWKGRVPRGSP